LDSSSVWAVLDLSLCETALRWRQRALAMLAKPGSTFNAQPDVPVPLVAWATPGPRRKAPGPARTQGRRFQPTRLLPSHAPATTPAVPTHGAGGRMAPAVASKIWRRPRRANPAAKFRWL
jgi:hypothetical protein